MPVPFLVFFVVTPIILQHMKLTVLAGLKEEVPNIKALSKVLMNTMKHP
jgi:hypothetical protein